VSREMIHRLVAAEAEARVLVRDGELAAERIVTAAQEEGRRRMAAFRAEARRVSRAVLESTLAEARLEAERRVRAGVAEFELRFVLSEEKRGRLMDALVACLVGEEGGG
jgi:vacuolar-type H+-ATPase subunit H